MSKPSNSKRKSLAKSDLDSTPSAALVYENDPTVDSASMLFSKRREFHAPKHWQSVYQLIKDYRLTHLAPVDTLGCDQLSPKDSNGQLLPEVSESDRRFHTLIGLLFSSQTKDAITAAAMNRVHAYCRKHYQSSFNPQTALKIPTSDLEQIIAPVGFYKKKSMYLKEISSILLEQYSGQVPNTLEGLLALPGIGKKMAYLCLSSAYNIHEGIGVDVHVGRISERLGWVPKGMTDPNSVREVLESWLPSSDYYYPLNKLLVGFGQILCTAVNPGCDRCPVNMYCRYYQERSKNAK